MAASSPMSMDAPPGRTGAGGSFSPTALVGGASPASPMPDMQQQAKGFVNQVRTLHTQIDAIAKQFPAGASELKKAQDALKEAMIKVISEMQRPEQGGQAPQ